MCTELIRIFTTVLQQQINTFKTVLQYSIMTTTIDYKKLRSKLPRGYAKTLAFNLDVSESAVYQTVTGKIKSDVILAAAVRLAQENSQKNNDLASQINAL